LCINDKVFDGLDFSNLKIDSGKEKEINVFFICSKKSFEIKKLKDKQEKTNTAINIAEIPGIGIFKPMHP